MKPRLDSSFLNVPLAHRALHDVSDGRPENSLAAIRAAISSGYAIEVDVQMSADGQAMVFHDYVLDRLSFGQGRLNVQSSASLQALQLRGGQEGIPRLSAVLSEVSGAVPLLIEIKDQDGAMGSNIGALEAAVAADLRHYEGSVAVMSFNPHSVQRLADLLPDIARGLVTGPFYSGSEGLSEDVCARLREIPDYDAAHCSFISHDRRDLDRPRVHALKAEGAHVLCWTVRSREQEIEARKTADNITFEKYLAAFPS